MTSRPSERRTLATSVFRLLIVLALVVGVAARSISAAPVAEPANNPPSIPVNGQAATPISAEDPTPTETVFEPAAELTISIELWLPRVNPVTTDPIAVVAQFTGSQGNGQVRGSVQFAICGPDSVQPCTTAEATPLGAPKTFSVPRVKSPDFTPADTNATGVYCFLVEFTPESGSAYQPTTFTDSSACVTLSLPSLTIVLAGKDDGAAGGGHLVDFGTVSPFGASPTVDGVTVTRNANGATYLAYHAVVVTVKAVGTGWIGTCYTSTPAVQHLDLAWQLGSNAPAPFASNATGGRGCLPPARLGTTEGSYGYDLSLSVGWDAPSGPWSSTIVFSVTPP